MMSTIQYNRLAIRQEPFNSPICQDLITNLDAEVDGLYPDAAEFPYQGPDTQEVVWQNEDPVDMLMAEQRGELFFFVVFMSRDSITGGTTYDSVTRDKFSDSGTEEEAIGCVGVRALPYFPLHRAPSGTDVSHATEGDLSATLHPTDQVVEPATAEVKRLYVDPKYRGRRKDVSSDDESVALVLLRHVEGFAKQYMCVERLVLETGMRQEAAIHLFQKMGWAKRKVFGDYVGAGEDVGGLSRCWERWL